MEKMKVKALVFLLALLSSVESKAYLFEYGGIGGDFQFNIPIAESGIGLRSHLHFNEMFFLSPQVNYYPGLQNIHELYAGANINWKWWPGNNWSLYPTAGAYYNMYINAAQSAVVGAKQHNLTFQGGIGLTKNWGCYRPYVEYRVDSKWNESNIRVGIMFYFRNCGQKSRKSNNSNHCPAFTLNN